MRLAPKHTPYQSHLCTVQAAANSQAGSSVAGSSQQSANTYVPGEPAGTYAVPPLHPAAVPLAQVSEDADFELALRLQEQERAAVEREQAQQRLPPGPGPPVQGAQHQAMRHSGYGSAPPRPAAAVQGGGAYGMQPPSGRGRGQFTAARHDGPIYVEPTRDKKSKSDCSIM